jgi:hypothetical protein
MEREYIVYWEGDKASVSFERFDFTVLTCEK